LKKYGQRLDLEIAKEMGVPLATVRHQLAGLAATGEVITCN
jgi:predicted ArsR family transcriptional regulator